MADLTFTEKMKLEKLLGMSGGYVLGFSNRTFEAFVADSTGRNIYESEYEIGGGSKANRLRAFWDREPNSIVGKLLSDLLDYRKSFGSGDDDATERLHIDCCHVAQRLLLVAVPSTGAPRANSTHQSATPTDPAPIGTAHGQAAPGAEVERRFSTATTVRRVRLFVSYASSDAEYFAEFEKHLSGLRREQLIEYWHERQVAPGENVAARSEEQLELADIVVLLISADFLASDYIQEKHMARALQRHQAGRARIVPVIVRSAEWHSLPLGDLRPLPKDGKAISTWQHQDDAWLDVVRGVRSLVQDARHTWSVAADNDSLRAQLNEALAVKQNLSEQLAALRREHEELFANHRHFDSEVAEAASSARAETRAANAQIAELTSKLGEALGDLEFQRQRADALARERQELLMQNAQMSGALKEAKLAVEQLTWKSDSRLDILSGGIQEPGSDKTVARWTFALFNSGRTDVRLLRFDANWFLPAPTAGADPVSLLEQARIYEFAERPVIRPGRRSATYEVKIDAREIDNVRARDVARAIQPRVQVVYESIDGQCRGTSGCSLARGGKIDD
jgi:hypothetical protein